MNQLLNFLRMKLLLTKIMRWYGPFISPKFPTCYRQKINPYTRKHIPFDIREKWYNYLDNKLIPLHYPPLCVGDLQYVTLNEPILSQGQKSITKMLRT